MTRVSTRSRHSLRREITTAFSAAILVLGACMTAATQWALHHALSESGLPEGVQDHLGQHLIYTLTGLAIVGTAFGLVVTGILSRMITQPVRRLVQAVERMDAVNLDTVLDASGSREFGLLADAFNGMTARLKKAHESLESQVEQRTAELASTNATLLFEISLRKKAEKRLAYLATFPERNPSPVLEVDWNGSVRYANPAARDLFPDICERQSEHPWLADWAGVMRMVQEQDPATATRDLAIDGRSYQQLFYHFPQDKFVRIYGLDITDRKKAEGQQTELLRKLSETNRQLQDFAYVVSHDLKAPLRGIRTLVDWLGADYADKLDEQGRENLALLDNRAGRMQSLIDGILQYSRVGRTEQGVESVDLSRLLPEILDALDAPSHIAVSIETELPTVEGDVTRITQVFQNLLSNAMK
ncbi:MAG: HAMP domain-containing protein [Phycisphaerales bacterium]